MPRWVVIVILMKLFDWSESLGGCVTKSVVSNLNNTFSIYTNKSLKQLVLKMKGMWYFVIHSMIPNVHLSARLSVRPFARLSKFFCLAVFLSICLTVKLAVNKSLWNVCGKTFFLKFIQWAPNISIFQYRESE